MINVIISITILFIYIIVICVKNKAITYSLSDSVFTIPIDKRWIWTIVLFAVCFLCVPTIIDKASENTKFLAFLAIAGLAFVGAAPLVKFKDDKLQFRVHEGGAIVCAVCSQLLLMFNQPLLLLLWIPFIITGLIINFKKWKTMIFWGEMVCFSSTFLFCLI